MNESKGKKIHDFSGFIDKDFKSEKEETDSIYLTQNEIQRIYDLEITEDLLRANDYKNQNLITTINSLKEERDRFLFGCFTALRHSDYSRLDAIHFKEDIIRIWTVKRDKKVFIPMHYQLRELLKRRNNILPSPIEINFRDRVELSDEYIDGYLLHEIEKFKADSGLTGKKHIIQKIEFSLDGEDWYLVERDIVRVKK